MAKSSSNGSAGVPRSTVFLVAFGCLFLGFFIGFMSRDAVEDAASPGRPAAGQQAMPGMPPAGMGGQGMQMPPQGMGGKPAQGTAQQAELEKRAKANPTDAHAWEELGHFYFDTDQPAKAVEAYRKSLDLQPKNPNTWTDMGVMYRELGDTAQALNSFDQALALEKGHKVARLNKGVVLLHDKNDPAAAIKVWEELLVIDPKASMPDGKPLADVVKEVKAKTK